MAKFDQVVTDHRLGHDTAATHLKAGGHLLDEFHVVASGGSSGQRGIFVYGWDAWATCYASISRFQLRDWSADPARPAWSGSPPPSPPRSRATSRPPSVGPSAARPSHWSCSLWTLPLHEIVAGLNALAPTILMGYSSFLPRLALEARAGRLRIAPRRVITISEPLLPSSEPCWRRHGRCRWPTPTACPRASSAASVGTGSTFPTTSASSRPSTRTGTTWPPGESSARLLVTNLYNPVLPLIRYEVTDEVRIRSGPCACGSSFRRIEDPQGRLDDLFVYRTGTVVHPHSSGPSSAGRAR